MWLHTTFAFLYLLLTVYSMRRHTSKMHYKEDDLVGLLLSENICFIKQLLHQTVWVLLVTICLYFHAGETHFICQFNLQICRRVWDKATLWVSAFFPLLVLLPISYHFVCLNLSGFKIGPLVCFLAVSCAVTSLKQATAVAFALRRKGAIFSWLRCLGADNDRFICLIVHNRIQMSGIMWVMCQDSGSVCVYI